VHMNPFTTFLFPDTAPLKETHYPLLLCCAPMGLLQTIEPDPARANGNDADIFIKSGLCQAHTPAPMGPDRERFTRLVGDIRLRTDDYAAQLSALTMAAMSAPRTEKNQEARHQIVSSLLRGGDMNKPTTENGLDFWQARLVLAIAEILEEKEEEVRQSLLLLDEREMDMLRQLQGEGEPDGDDPFAEITRIKARLEAPRPREYKIRFKSWQRLMANAPVPPVSVWLASTQDGADQVFTKYEGLGESTALPLVKLPLPAVIPASDQHVVQQVKDFRKAAAAALASLGKDLDDAANRDVHAPATADELLPSGSGYLSAWQALLDDHFPASSHGRIALVFYLLPNQPVARLLGLDQSDSALPATRHGLMGVLQR